MAARCSFLFSSKKGASLPLLTLDTLFILFRSFSLFSVQDRGYEKVKRERMRLFKKTDNFSAMNSTNLAIERCWEWRVRMEGEG